MAKKDFGSESDPISGGAQKATAMGLPSLQEVDAQVFGNGIIPDSGQQVARPISLDQISPDPTQPRREVPSVVRNRARENNLPEWQMWHQMAERQLGHEIPLKALLRGEGEGAETEKSGMPLVDGFMALVALAASIFDKGLVNPITVSPRGMDQYMIETGERRYQAYRLLDGVLGLKKFSKIVANKVSAVDVWRQAAENGSRKPLNAIGMARQIALLIMALNDDKSYEPFEAFAGQSDRLFYAQVADGITHRIPKGASEKILQATGMKSRSQIQNYRALLDVSDDVWQQADEDDWAEFKIREMVRPARDMSSTDDISSRDMSTAVNVSPTNPPMSIKAGQGPGTKATGTRLLYRGKEVEYIDSDPRHDKTGMDVKIWHMNSSGIRTFSETVHSRETQDLPHADIGKPSGGIDYDRLPRQSYGTSAPQMPPAAQVPMPQPGEQYRNTQGRVFEVLGVLAGMAQCAEINPVSGSRLPGTFDMILNSLRGMPKLRRAEHPTPALPAAQGGSADNPLSIKPDEFRVGDQVTASSSDLIWTVTAVDGDFLSLEAHDGKDKHVRPMDLARYVKKIEPIEENAPPAWAQAGRLVRDVERDLDGKVISSYRNSNTHVWMVRVAFEDHVSTLPLDVLEAHEGEILNDLPAWAVPGATIRHKPSGEIGTIVFTIWDELESRWAIRAQKGPGEWADLPESECEPYIEEEASPAPIEPHPALHPNNASSVISEHQYRLGAIWAAAIELKMPAAVSQINRMRVLTPNTLAAFLREDGEEGGYAHVLAMYVAGIEVLNAALDSLNAVRDEAYEVMQQMAAKGNRS